MGMICHQISYWCPEAGARYTLLALFFMVALAVISSF